MRKIDFFGDKEYIVHVTNSYTVFRFPDGSKISLETCKEQLVLYWDGIGQKCSSTTECNGN